MTVMNGDNRKAKRPYPLIVLTVLAGLIGVAGFWAGADSPAGSDRFYFRNSGGAVLFEHNNHIDEADGCESCHHNLFLSDSRNECTDCHDDGMSAEDFTHADLKEIDGHSCAGCHQLNETIEAGSCRQCHPAAQESDERLIACSTCHDDDYTPDMLTHDEMQEVEGHECDGCHNISTASGAYHEQCSGCHLQQNPDKFAATEGGVRCEQCHLK